MTKAMIFNIQRFSTEDGPGIRTTVFFKGCPLRCVWCSNPESQNTYPEVSHRARICAHCGKCAAACEAGAISVTPELVVVDRALCTNCGKCVETCPYGAMTMMGKSMTLEEVFREVIKDKDFYEQSGGGITASGGEALMQGKFVAHLLERCQAEGLHTCLDTCGYGDTSVLQQVLRHTNLVLFDLKFIDAALHKQYTGVSNELILQNVRAVDESGVQMIIRMPVIPSITGSEQNIRDIAGFVSSLKHKTPVSLLSYHRLGLSKYDSLDREYELKDEKVPSREYMHEIQSIFLAAGVECKISS